MNTKEYDGFSDSFSEQAPEGEAARARKAEPPVAPARQASPASSAAAANRVDSRSGSHSASPELTNTLDGEKKKSATMGVWLALIAGAALLVLLLVFIVQNNVATSFEYFTWQFSLPLGVAMLLAAIVGGLIMALVGSIRIAQLSWELRKYRKQQEKLRHTLGR